MKHRVPHDLGQEKARKVTEAAWQSYSERFSKYAPTCVWTSESTAKIGFTAKGMKVEGEIDIQPTSIDLELDVPFLLKPFKGVAISVIEEEINKWIAKSKVGEI